jgi:hypothetical protein
MTGALGLDHLSPSRKDGFKTLADAPPRQQPELLDHAQIGQLGPGARDEYTHRRAVWHANLTIRTQQLADVHEDLWDIVDSNCHDGDRVKPAVAIDALPGLGKTTAASTFGREYHRREIARRGEFTVEGHEHLPVCRVGLTSEATMWKVNDALLEFYGHPGRRGNAKQLASRALDCILSCHTKIVIVDDVHFLDLRRRDGVAVSNHFKWLSNELPPTFIFVGVGLRERGLFCEGMTAADAPLAQTGRRWTRLTMNPFTITDEAGRRQWRRMLLAIEQMLVLAGKYPGMVADDLADYLFARSSGHLASLMCLVNRGAQRAIRTGAETLTVDLLDQVKIDEAAEQARGQLAAALHAGRLRARPRAATTAA